VPTVTEINYTCQAGFTGSPPFATFPSSVIVEGDGPASVEPGEDFKIVIKPPDNLPAFIPLNFGDLQVVELTEARFLVNFPTNATFHSASLTGGSGFSSSDVVETDEGLLQILRGPVPAGGQLVAPSLTIKVEADVPDTKIKTTAGGSSFNKPGFEEDFIVRDTRGELFNVTQTCFPNQKTVLTTTIVKSEHNNDNHDQDNLNNQFDQNHVTMPHKVCD
jgi:hypothetical protein